jgi:hypothetical protein
MVLDRPSQSIGVETLHPRLERVALCTRINAAVCAKFLPLCSEVCEVHMRHDELISVDCVEKHHAQRQQSPYSH